MVWAGQNPDNGVYKVFPLGPELVDRFHAHIVLEGVVQPDYYKKLGIPDTIVDAVVTWYKNDLSDAQRKFFSPRSLEHLCLLAKNNMDVDSCMLQSKSVMSYALKNRLKGVLHNTPYDNVTIAKMSRNIEKYKILATQDVNFCTHVLRTVRDGRIRMASLAALVPLLISLPKEFIAKIIASKLKVKLYKLLTKKGSLISKSVSDTSEYRSFFNSLQHSVRGY